ncbi:MAG: sensor histidine kinase [Spirochaetaceae bacterium]|nr:sensor histidine kinase [Spirochaetaceae bacterium]
MMQRGSEAEDRAAIESLPLAARRWFQGPVRHWAEGAAALLLLLAFAAFAQSLLDTQAAFGEDRADLMMLQESWGVAASGYGLRGDRRASMADFLVAYSGFRSRPSVRRLLRSDAEFAALAASADAAFNLLETAERRGDPAASRAAADFDRALGAMAARVGDYSRERLEASRRSFAILISVLVATGVVFVVMERRLRRTSAEEARNRALARALISAQEGERLRISRELHDAVAQDLAAAKLYCGLAGGADSLKAATLLDRSIAELREICEGLRPAELDRLGIGEACSRLCSDTSRSWGIAVEYRATGMKGVLLAPEAEINLYRILQEALSNVRRHSGARTVRVALRGGECSVELSVEDDGRGPGASTPGLGRRGMEERARMIGGQYRLGPGAAGGTLVTVAVPART